MSNPVDLVNGDVTVTVTGDPMDTTTTHYRQPPSSHSGGEKCCAGCMTTIALLAWLAMRVSCLCFFVSGAVFLGEEYTHIPDCASAYRGWGITMTVLCGLVALKNNSKESSSSLGTTSERAFGIGAGIGLWFVSVFSFLIAFLGHRDVLQKHEATCDMSGISQLETWTWWIYGYYGILTILLWVMGLFLIVGGCCSR